MYWLTSEPLTSINMRSRSLLLSGCSVAIEGQRPTNSGINLQLTERLLRCSAGERRAPEFVQVVRFNLVKESWAWFLGTALVAGEERNERLLAAMSMAVGGRSELCRETYRLYGRQSRDASSSLQTYAFRDSPLDDLLQPDESARQYEECIGGVNVIGVVPRWMHVSMECAHMQLYVRPLLRGGCPRASLEELSLPDPLVLIVTTLPAFV